MSPEFILETTVAFADVDCDQVLLLPRLFKLLLEGLGVSDSAEAHDSPAAQRLDRRHATRGCAPFSNCATSSAACLSAAGRALPALR